MSQPIEHKADHRHIHEGLARLRQPLVVPAQPPLPVQPGKRTLNNPPLGQYHKSLLAAQSLYDLQRPTQLMLHPLHQLASVATVRPDQLQAAKAPPMRVCGLLDTLPQCAKHYLGSISILYRAGSDHHKHHQTQHVHDQVSLATTHLLGCVVATLLSTLRCLCALAVHNSRTWSLVASQFLSQLLSQRGVEPFPGTIHTPLAEVMVHRPPRRKVMWQPSPQAAILGHIENGVENLSPRVLTRA